MARKTQARHGKVTILKTDADFIKRQEARFEELEEGSPEWKAWERYIAVCKDDAEAQARVEALAQKIEDEHLIPDKFREEFEKLLSDAAKQSRRVTQALVGFEMLRRNTFTVPEKDIRQITYDALMSNAEAIPDEEGAVPMHKHHTLKRIADEIIEELKTGRVKVREEAQQVPMCLDCEKELAA
jgi:uncharacterized protein YifE (UPF0438 family)